jgi:hypothetical protein
MLSRSKVLGKLACLVIYKFLGIRTAKRNWKQVKQIKYGDRANLGKSDSKDNKRLWTIPAGEFAQ